MNLHTLRRGAWIVVLALLLMPITATAQDEGWTPFTNADGTITLGVPDGWTASEAADGTITITNVAAAEGDTAALTTGFAPGEGEVTLTLRQEPVGTMLDAVMDDALNDMLRGEGIVSYSAQYKVTMGRYQALQVIVTTADEHRLLVLSDLGNGEFAQFVARCGLDQLVALEYELNTPMRTLDYISYVRTVLTGHTDDVLALAISADGTMLASGGRDRTIILWNLDGDEPAITATLEGHTSDVVALDFNSRGDRLVSGGRDRVALVWNLESGEVRNTLDGHSDTVSSVRFHPSSVAIYTGGGSFDTNVIEWGATNGDIQTTFRGHTDAVQALVFSPDEMTLVSAGADGTIIRWDMHTDAPVSVLTPGGEIMAVAYHPDGAILASAGDDDVITFWDTALDIEVATFEGHTDTVTGIAFSPDGALLASSSADGMLMLWDVAAVMAQLDAGAGGEPLIAAPLAVLRGHTNVVNDVAFGPEGLLLASASADGTVRLWDLTAVLAHAAGTTGE